MYSILDTPGCGRIATQDSGIIVSDYYLKSPDKPTLLLAGIGLRSLSVNGKMLRTQELGKIIYNWLRNLSFINLTIFICFLYFCYYLPLVLSCVHFENSCLSQLC